jgi:hypothetical protein
MGQLIVSEIVQDSDGVLAKINPKMPLFVTNYKLQIYVGCKTVRNPRAPA